MASVLLVLTMMMMKYKSQQIHFLNQIQQ